MDKFIINADKIYRKFKEIKENVRMSHLIAKIINIHDRIEFVIIGKNDKI